MVRIMWAKHKKKIKKNKKSAATPTVVESIILSFLTLPLL